MDNILDRKHRWELSNLEIFIRMLYYPALIITLLFFAFRHSTTKTFFLSLLGAVVLSILTALFMAFSYRSEAAFFGWVIFYFFLFLVISLSVWRNKTRNVVAGISINLFLFLIPLIPLCIVSYYYTTLDYPYYDRFYEERERHLLLAEVGGLVLLLVLIPTYIQAAYRRWYSSPEE
jgi:small-conductance mechanosensitive channel